MTTRTPDKFYKYRPITQSESRLEGTLLRGEIYFAPASTFNDPFELNVPFDLSASAAEKRKDFARLAKKFESGLGFKGRQKLVEKAMTSTLHPSNREKTEADVSKRHAEWIRDKFGIYSLSEKVDDILMWSHYADSHRGVCIEFSGAGTLAKQAQQVTYSETREAIRYYSDSDDEKLRKGLLLKSSQWSYEAEWRALRYKSGPGLDYVPLEEITGLFLGAQISAAHINLIRSWLSTRRLALPLYKCELSRKTFALEVRPYTPK